MQTVNEGKHTETGEDVWGLPGDRSEALYASCALWGGVKGGLVGRKGMTFVPSHVLCLLALACANLCGWPPLGRFVLHLCADPPCAGLL